MAAQIITVASAGSFVGGGSTGWGCFLSGAIVVAVYLFFFLLLLVVFLFFFFAVCMAAMQELLLLMQKKSPWLSPSSSWMLLLLQSSGKSCLFIFVVCLRWSNCCHSGGCHCCCRDSTRFHPCWSSQLAAHSAAQCQQIGPRWMPTGLLLKWKKKDPY